MTYRTVWTPNGTVFPEWDDHDTEEAATRQALATSREQNVEVAVIPLDSTNGHHHVTTHQLDATEQRENR